MCYCVAVMLQRVAVCCSMLQRVAACCSVLQCEDSRDSRAVCLALSFNTASSS